jgi:hypothetical protein
VNTNQVFSWRRQYREGWFNEDKNKTTGLVPVKISGVGNKPMALKARTVKVAGRTVSGTIDIDLGHARVRIEGAADSDCVRAALEGLLR